MHYDKLPQEQHLTFFRTLQIHAYHNSIIKILERTSCSSPYVRLRVKEKVLLSHRTINLHITLDGVNAVINWFWGHPFHREFLCILSTVHVLVDFSHQTKVWHFNSVISADQNITRCKVTMNEASLCEMILKNYEIIMRAQIIIYL